VVSGAWRGEPGVTPGRLWITAGLAFGGLCYLPIAFLVFSFILFLSKQNSAQLAAKTHRKRAG
jgi:hypothetical protein